MRLLIDMNMSPDLCSEFQAVGREALHWSALGAPNAPDTTIMAAGALVIVDEGRSRVRILPLG
ncbi:MAG: hypothetical protein JWL65_5110 [Gammaproteobacteria bacterium]|jgi:predicted nuclease of predicted toxin-antitoxin system|nr:hypothetical protein [Gammaproteobacteria bacterium]